MKRKKLPLVLCNILCIVLMLALLICQCMPFWELGDEQISIQSYISFPSNYPQLTNFFEEQFGPDFIINDIVTMPVIALVIGVAGAVLCLLKIKKGWVVIFPLLDGISGILGYLTIPAFQMGNLWQLHLVLSILMVLLTVPGLIHCFHQTKNFFLNKQD